MPAALPRPHRFDVYIAVAGLLGGVGMWALGLGLSASGTGTLAPGWQLLPLTVMAGLELLRRSRPRTALVAGTCALVVDMLTPGNAATILMFTDLAYAAVLYGSPSAARRIPVVTGLVTVGVTPRLPDLVG